MSEESFGQKLKNYIKNLVDFSRFNWKEKILIAFFIVLVGASILLYIWTILIDETLLTRIVVQYFIIPIGRLEFFGVAIVLIFMIIQGLIFPIPSELVQLSMGIIWKIIGGTIMGVLGTFGAGIVCFYVARRGGRPVVENAVGVHNLEVVENWLEKNSFAVILFGRLIPVIPFDLISYVSGFVKSIKWKEYLIATFLGSIVRSLFYAYLGAQLFPLGVQELIFYYDIPFIGPIYLDNVINQVSAGFNLILTLTILGLAGFFIMFQFVIIPYARRKQEEESSKASESTA